jgi:hypothetical protein
VNQSLQLCLALPEILTLPENLRGEGVPSYSLGLRDLTLNTTRRVNVYNIRGYSNMCRKHDW